MCPLLWSAQVVIVQSLLSTWTLLALKAICDLYIFIKVISDPEPLEVVCIIAVLYWFLDESFCMIVLHFLRVNSIFNSCFVSFKVNNSSCTMFYSGISRFLLWCSLKSSRDCPDLKRQAKTKGHTVEFTWQVKWQFSQLIMAEEAAALPFQNTTIIYHICCCTFLRWPLKHHLRHSFIWLKLLLKTPIQQANS